MSKSRTFKASSKPQVLVDRQSGAKKSLAEAGYTMHAVLVISQLLDYWEGQGRWRKLKLRR
jgi:orotate phosphoribosyltransferase